MTKTRFQIQGMHCVNCAMIIDNAVEEMSGVKAATTNYARQRLDVEYDEQQVTPAEIIHAVQEAGYTASVPRPDQK